MDQENLLLVSDSERDADMLYAVRMFMADPFIYAQLRGRRLIVVPDQEMARAKRMARHCLAISLQACQRALLRDGIQPNQAEVVRWLLRREGVKRVLVPDRFPHGLAKQLRQRKLKLRVRPGSFFPQRGVKSAEEVKKISAALIMAEVGLAEAIQVLRNSRVGKQGRLIHHGVPLTAEKLRAVINIAILQAGGLAHRTIVACGRQTCDPHETGHGPLKANQPIVLDVFPRSLKTGYYGDITRTVVRGRASEAVRRMYHCVVKAQDLAFTMMRDGTLCSSIHRRVQDLFAANGYRTGRRGGRPEGYFHGTGHGVGLDVHEAPRLNASSVERLEPGNVVAVEPGLYYWETGGVRLEDLCLVGGNGPRNLTEFEKVLEV